jgi:multidrug efflux pump subunit AcrA (membrane-fusion protein)
MKKIMAHKKIAIGTAVVIAIFIIWRLTAKKTVAVNYQTATATKGTLVTNVSASGNVTSGNRLSITTSATGTINHVYVKNGDQVVTGEKIADMTLDQNSQQQQAAALSSLLSAKNSLFNAQTNLYQLQSAEFTANQKFINDAVERNLDTTDPTYIEENAQWLQAEAQYKNQTNVISQAQASLTSAQINYQQVSPTILSPTNGTVSDLSLAPGLPLISQNSSSNNSNTNTPQTVGTVTLPNGRIQAVVDVSEIDSPNVSPGQNVTMTLDAFPNKTFTGKVLLINTNGVTSSGVTSYPTTILFDSSAGNIYPNMSVTASIITKVEDGVILVPTAAVQTNNGQSEVGELVNGKEIFVTVQTGDSNDTQTVITSGVKDGDTVVTGTTGGTATTTTTSSTGSVFSRIGGGGGGFGGGGGAVRVVGR